MKRIILMAMAVLTLAACNNSGKSAKKLLPSVSGKAGEVFVVMEKSFWEGNLGNEVRELLGSDCPYLVQREPLYSLVNITPSNFVNMFQVHRNIVMVEVNPQLQNEGLQYLNDIWSHPQCVIKLSAATEENAIQILRSDGEILLNAIEQAERDRVIGNTLLYEEKSIAPQIAEIFGGAVHFPNGYKLKKKTDDFVWVADDKKTIQGVFVYKYPAAGDESDFNIDNIIAHRNETLKENVPGMFDNTYMITADFLQPTEKFIKYKNFTFAEVRGFWEVYNDYMGGPFVSHSFYSQDGKDVIVLEAFVYAPQCDKRQLLRQVESLLYSFEWKQKKE